MSTPSLRHFIDRALAMYVPRLDHAFPGCFDWARLCAETPEMVERVSEGRFDARDAAAQQDVLQAADEVFRLAHVSTLAVLSAGRVEEDDPEEFLDSFGTPPDDEEEQRFEVLAGELLGPLEESLADDGVRLDERGYLARDLAEQVWPIVETVLVETAHFGAAGADTDDADTDDADAEDRDADDMASADESEEASRRPVLLALARVASILAILRWMAALEDAADEQD